jgi:hypothetical protein
MYLSVIAAIWGYVWGTCDRPSTMVYLTNTSDAVIDWVALKKLSIVVRKMQTLFTFSIASLRDMRLLRARFLYRDIHSAVNYRTVYPNPFSDW